MPWEEHICWECGNTEWRWVTPEEKQQRQERIKERYESDPLFRSFADAVRETLNRPLPRYYTKGNRPIPDEKSPDQ